MLAATLPPDVKRKAFRSQLNSGRLMRMPGAFSPLVAQLVAELGFEGVYVSGAALSADLGLPDIGLTTLTEVTGRAGAIARATNLPTLVDVDTGFGEPMNAFRTIREIEAAGLAGCHLEDQVAPKRCGHLDNKAVVPVEEMVRRIKAAVEARMDPNFVICARTDARAMEGLDAAIARMQAYAAAGADLIFPEAMATAEDFAKVRAALQVPILANMTEFGKSQLLSVAELEALGVNLVIWPVTTLRLAMGEIERGLKAIAEAGHQRDILDRMQHRSRLYELIRYEDYNRFDQALFNFQIPGL